MLQSRSIVVVLALGLLASVSYAQRKPAVKPARPAAPVRKMLPAEPVSFGSTQTDGAVSREQFMRDLAGPLRTNGTVGGFTFMYGERSMYEDSAGAPMLVTDYLTQYCYGDTLPVVIRTALQQRCKVGDTAYFSGITVIKADGTQTTGKALKLTIAR